MKINIRIFNEQQYLVVEKVVFDFNEHVWFVVYENIENTKNITFVFRKEHHQTSKRLYNFLSKYNAEFVPLEL